MIRAIQNALIAAVVASATVVAGAEPRTVIVFGDSITAGDSLPAADRGRAWIGRVEEMAGGDLRMVNEGKGGRPTGSVAEFDAMLVRRPAVDGLVIALGTNDSRTISDECVPRAVANLTRMIEKARQRHGHELPILIVGPPNINKQRLGATRPIANEREARLVELGAAFEQLAGQEGCRFVSLYGRVPPDSLAADGVHPDAEGNEAIAEVLLPAIRAMLGTVP